MPTHDNGAYDKSLPPKIVIARAIEAWRLGRAYEDVVVASGASCIEADAIVAALERHGLRFV